MILEYIIDYRSSSNVYEKIFLKTLAAYSLSGKLLKEGFSLKCYIETDNIEDFENFATDFARRLPHSIFLHDTQVNVVEEMPEGEYLVDTDAKIEMPFCLECLETVFDESSPHYYDIFQSCELCGYDVEGEHRSYKEDFQEMAELISEGKTLTIDTFYGKYNIGKIDVDVCDSIDFDIIAYDYATVQKFTHAKDYELKALASMEKPFIRLKTNIKFKTDVEDLKDELIRFKLPDDFVLQFLMHELHLKDIDMIFITKDEIKTDKSISLVKAKKEKEPIEVVAASNNVVIIKGNKGLFSFPVLTEKIAPIIGATYSVIKEHNLDDDNIAGVYLSKEYQNGIVIYGKKYGVVNHLTMECSYGSIQEIFEQIASTNETGKKLINAYRSKYSDHCEKISKIKFNQETLNIYDIWGVISIILDFSSSANLKTAAKILEDNAVSFLGNKGPRIDYKIYNKNSITTLDYLMIIRSAMSFKLAGIDDLTLSYGVIESFVEFLVNELESVNDSVGVESIVIAGSLLENSKLFSKLSVEGSINNNMYFNNQLLVDHQNITYGDYIL